MIKDIWEKKPTGTKFISEEDFEEWLAYLKAELDDLKADAEIARKTVGFESWKETLRDIVKEGSHTIISKEAWDEKTEKAKKWDQYAIYDNEKDEEILVKDLITAYKKLEAIRKLLGRQPHNDIRINFTDKLKEILEAEG